MAMEYIKDMDSLLEIVERGNIISFPYGAEGVSFLEWLRHTDRLDNVLCVTQRSGTTLNRFLCDRPLIHLGMLPHLREDAVFIISGPDSAYPGIHKSLIEFGCKTVYCLHVDVRNEMKNELNDLRASGDMEVATLENLTERLNGLDGLMTTQTEICRSNATAFEPYRNCHRGKKVVIVGAGETAQYYEPIPDAVHIAVDGVAPRDDISFDFRFIHETNDDGSLTITFFDANLNKSCSFAVSDGAADQVLYQDISAHPLSNFGDGRGVAEALHFAEFTFPDALYLVGCDLTSEGEAVLSQKIGLARLKMLVGKSYPGIKLFSINPIGLKGLFQDIYTEGYEVAIEEKAMLASEPAERIALNKNRLANIQQAVAENNFGVAYNEIEIFSSDTPKENLKLYENELVSIWQAVLPKVSSENKSVEQKNFEGALSVVLDNMIRRSPEDGASVDVVARLNDFALNCVKQLAARKHWKRALRFAEIVKQLNQPLNPNDNVLMAEVFYHNDRRETTSEYVLRAAAPGKFSKVMVVDTVLTTLLYILIFDDWRDTCFVAGNWLNRAFINKLLHYGVPGFYSKNFFGGIDSDKTALKKLAAYVKDNKIPTYGHDHLAGMAEFFVDENFSVIEDGLGNYRETTPRPSRTLSNGTRYITFGYDKLIKHVYLTARKPVPKPLAEKAIIVDMVECGQRRTPEEQKIIADIFSVPMERLLELFAQGRDQILLTQPMQETFGGDIAERKRKVVEFYKKVLARYDKSRVFIKTHPRDSINYARFIPDCPIVSVRFPIEFLKLLGLSDKIDKMISVHCSANDGVIDRNKVDALANEWKNFLKTGEL